MNHDSPRNFSIYIDIDDDNLSSSFTAAATTTSPHVEHWLNGLVDLSVEPASSSKICECECDYNSNQPVQHPDKYDTFSPQKRRPLAELSRRELASMDNISRRTSPRKPRGDGGKSRGERGMRMGVGQGTGKKGHTTPLLLGTIDAEDEFDKDLTSKSNKNLDLAQFPLRSLSLPQPPPSSTRSSASIASSNTSAAYLSRTRSKSPSKRNKDAQLSTFPVSLEYFDNPAYIQAMTPWPQMLQVIKDLVSLADGEEVFSPAVATLAKEHSPLHNIRDRHIQKTPNGRDDDLSDADYWKEVLKIQRASQYCRLEKLSEPSWNEDVHARLLRLALEGRWENAGVWFRNTTVAKIDDPVFLETMESRMVDYCITIGHTPEFREITQTYLKSHSLNSINHTSSAGMAFNPIAISLETKRARIDEDDAYGQLTTWSSAHYAFLRRLVTPETLLPPLILIIVQGNEWHLIVRVSTGNPGEAGKIFIEINIADTSSVVGIVKGVACLKRIAKYADEEYRPWFEREVFGL